MNKIIIEVVDSSAKMRFPYCNDLEALGDWYVDDSGDIRILVVGNHPLEDDMAFLVAIHELIEMKLCQKAGVKQVEVDEFDAKYEGDGEPGEDLAAPYFDQHRKATIVEYLVATWLGYKHYNAS